MNHPHSTTAVFKANWESLQQYCVPSWFQDAKLGIFIHWGVYAVPGFDNEWYPRNMYRTGSAAFEHHRETWGNQKRFGYKDFIPLFKAERWDPADWISLFKEAGARYVVPVAEHHDGFPMYASNYTRWNAAKMGTQRDIVAALAEATRAQELKFGVSSHRAFNWRYYTYSDEFDTTDPSTADLYSLPHRPDVPASPMFLDNWFGRTSELIDHFQPDLLWFDFGWHFDEFAAYRPQIAAYYYNRAADWGKGVVLNYKDKFPPGTAVYDIERGKLADIRKEYWQTDTSVSYKSWGYIQDDEFKTVTTIVHDLVDIVSKNGNLLLNVGPMADGTLPDEATAILKGLGAWLAVNGEAIYATRHWEKFGEGKTSVAMGHMTERKNQPFTQHDIRFTVKDNTLYAICLGWPESDVLIKSLGIYSPLGSDRIADIRMLGTDEPLTWSQDAAGLTITPPTTAPCEHAYTFKITLKDGR